MPHRDNTPQNGLKQLSSKFTSDTIDSLRQLYDMGKPADNVELRERIDLFFQFCQDKGLRPGVESLCLSIATDRTTFWKWCQGMGCDDERAQIASRARQFISCFLEQSHLQGKLNPASAIFLSKNWMGYRDSIDLEASPPTPGRRPQISKADMLGIDVDTDADVDAGLPDFGD